MRTLVITRGLPASGKTTWAQAWVNNDHTNRVRVNRDDMRHMLFGRYHGLTYAQEETVTKAQHAAVTAALKAGQSVVVDDTNLRAKHARALLDLAATFGAGWEVRDFTHVTVDECIARDVARASAGGRGVGADAIRGMHARYLGRPLPDVAPTDASTAPDRLYTPDESLPPAWSHRRPRPGGRVVAVNGPHVRAGRAGEVLMDATARTFTEEMTAAAAILRGPDHLPLKPPVREAAADLLEAASTVRGTPDPYALKLARAVVYAAARSRLGVPTQASAGGVNADAHPREGRSRSGIRVP